ncbi:MAG: Adenosylcobinamide amidohydrolase [Gemmatimonadetes bacterium]|nr:Adenosylcobinamide amidohydrolase [Gemmatimonadota bacterium]
MRSSSFDGLEASPLAAVTTTLADPWLVVRFAARHAVASWAVVGGGMRTAEAVAWLRIRNADLGLDVDPRALLAERMATAGLAGAVVLLTSASLDGFADVTRAAEGVSARCVATVGMGNALRAGDPPGVGSTIARVGTINLLVRVSRPLSGEAMLEALALAAEARALAVREANIPSLRSGLPATGTGTDCIVVAAPLAPDPTHSAHSADSADARDSAESADADRALDSEPYAGKHTAVGHVVGAAVADAITLGLERWREAKRK